MVHQDEVCNLYKMTQESFYRKAADEKESVGLWLEELKGKNYSTFKHSTFENDFTFGFSSPWQKQLLLNSIMVCLDATHCVSHIQRGIIHTIVARHPATGTGCPVAYMLQRQKAGNTFFQKTVFYFKVRYFKLFIYLFSKRNTTEQMLVGA